MIAHTASNAIASSQQGTSSGESSDVRACFSLVYFWHAFCLWWKLCIPAGLALATVVGLVVWSIDSPQYTASAWLRIASTGNYIAFPTSRSSSAGSSSFVATQVELIRSPAVLEAVVNRRDIAQIAEIKDSVDSVRWLRDRVGVKRVGRSELFLVSFRSHSPDLSSRIANAIVAAYMQHIAAYSNSSNAEMIRLLEQQRDLREVKLGLLRRELLELAGTTSSRVSLKQPLDSGLIALHERLAALEAEREILEAKLTIATDKLATATDKLSPEKVANLVEQQQEFVQMSRYIESLQQMRQENLKLVKDPKLLGPRYSKEAIKQHQERLRRLYDELYGKIESGLKQRLTEKASADVEVIRTAINEYLQRERILLRRITERQAAMANRDEVVIEFKRQDLARAEDVFRRIESRLEALKTEQDAPSRVAVLTEAKPPTQPDALIPKPVVLAAIGAFVLPLFLAFLWEVMIRRISDRKTLAHDLGLPVVGEIPPLPVQPTIPGLSRHRRFDLDMQLFRESVHNFRTNLLLLEPIANASIITVVSAVRDECKTTIATHLATSLAQVMREPVLLIDGDLRRPDVDRLLSIDGSQGLADVLISECTADEAIHRVGQSELYVMPAGRARVPVCELLHNGNFANIVQSIRKRFRYIIVDTPPLLVVGDALTYARSSDGVVLCVRESHSRATDIESACERLKMADTHPVGVVISGVAKMSRRSYRHDRYEYLDQVRENSRLLQVTS